jgi:hypothetical protein
MITPMATARAPTDHLFMRTRINALRDRANQIHGAVASASTIPGRDARTARVPGSFTLVGSATRQACVAWDEHARAWRWQSTVARAKEEASAVAEQNLKAKS